MHGGVKRYILRKRMIEKGDLLVVACSGGPDSMCLLDVMLRLRKTLGITVAVAHLDHGIRGKKAERDAKFVSDYAQKKKIKIVSGKSDVPTLARKTKTSIEEAARNARYAFFETVSSKFPEIEPANIKIALGHTADDQAETVLMRLLRGSGARGLAAIPPKRDIYIRPLLETSRAEIIAHLRKHEIPWVEDETNESGDYLRNVVRSELIPLLKKKYNPNIVETLGKTAPVMRDVVEYLDEQAEALAKKCLFSPGAIEVPRELLVKSHPAVAAALIERAIVFVKGSSRSVRAEHRVDIMEAAREKGTASFTLPGGLRAVVSKNHLRISRDINKPVSYDLPLVVPGETIIPQTGAMIHAMLFKRNIAIKEMKHDSTKEFFDFDKINGVLRVRNYLAGDRFGPFGMKGTKKVHDLFVDMGIPRLDRDKVPVVVCDEGILWIAPLRRSNLFPVTRHTENILRLELIAGTSISND